MDERVLEDAPGERRAPSSYGHGFSWQDGDGIAVHEVLEAAFDYRGNVTLGLATGEALTGYLANRDAAGADPFVQLFPADGSPRRRIAYREIRAIAFSGKDPASGKSWETWVRKWKAKKEAEARGERVGDIGLYPDDLD